ncbi:hypothetical protein H6P81_006141 [Aristolochia fimbriata]|uniref:Uncharacterized protein n=1 Tax=Aristolochia fimbriata TaxID=158543 RepID=A0AAV7F014_ARIFI|nr:hypothetical protein H6P81_006141 [Aristolochia fimbriata]
MAGAPRAEAEGRRGGEDRRGLRGPRWWGPVFRLDSDRPIMPSRFSYQTESESKETPSACPRPPALSTSAISSSPSLPLSTACPARDEFRGDRRASVHCCYLLLLDTESCRTERLTSGLYSRGNSFLFFQFTLLRSRSPRGAYAHSSAPKHRCCTRSGALSTNASIRFFGSSARNGCVRRRKRKKKAVAAAAIGKLENWSLGLLFRCSASPVDFSSLGEDLRELVVLIAQFENLILVPCVKGKVEFKAENLIPSASPRGPFVSYLAFTGHGDVERERSNDELGLAWLVFLRVILIMASRTNPANNADRAKAISGTQSSAEMMRTSRQRSLRLERDRASLHSIESRSLKLRDSAAIGDASKGAKSEELVKYMSNLPVYLQRAEVGDNLQGKALNFGVLDWSRLEKWKNDQRSGPLGGGIGGSASSTQAASLRSGNRNPASSSNSSPSSTAASARGEDEPTGPSSQRRKTSSLKDHLKRPTKEGRAPAPDRRPMPPKTVTKSSGGDHLEIKLENCAREAINTRIVSRNEERPSKSRTPTNSEDPVKEKKKNRGGDFNKSRAGSLVEPNRYTPDSGFGGRHDSRSSTLARSSGAARLEICSSAECGRAEEAKRHSFTDVFDLQNSALYSDMSYSCPLPCEFQSSKWPDIDLSTPVGVEVVRILSNDHCSFANSEVKQTVQSKDEDEKLIETSSEPLKPRISEAAVAPSAKLTAGRDRLNESFNSEAASNVRSSYSTTHCDKNGMASVDSSRCKGNGTGRSRQSPLRRMLEQVLKPRPSRVDELPTNCSKFGDAQEPRFEDPPVPVLGLRKSFTYSQSLKRNSNCPTGNQDEKRKKSSTSALLEITDNCGLPLLTFTPDEGQDILAAKMRKIFASGKDDDVEWIYTFYSVREVKKKGVGWINQGRKDRKYVPNIVGQMKISSSQCPKMKGKDSTTAVVWTKEFVLFGAELGEAAHEALDFLPTNELAAIVISSEEPLPQNTHGDVHVVKNLQNGPTTEYQKSSSVTVVIPSGVHSLPSSEGVPAPLIDRWRSGGCCDCGGWDLGCKLSALTNDGSQSTSLPQASLTSEDTRLIDLFLQGGPPETRHTFSLAAFKEGLFSAEFSGLISPVQAFAICVAILHDQQPATFPEVCQPLEKVSAEFTEKTAQSLGEAPGRYVPYPPHSPVGRV